MINNGISRNTVPNWLKWTLGIVGLLIIAFLIFAIYLYQAAQGNRTAAYDQVAEEVLQETELTAISSIERFHGENAYYIVYGETDHEENKIVFYPFDLDQSSIISLNQSEIVSEETVRANWNNQCNSCKMIDITPAVISDGDDQQPAWEITYEDNSGRYVMEYLSVSDGSRIEARRFNRLFNRESD
ncbi:DUF5590 domain-containing protein [Lentibacillus sp. CBA3610]|uniref:cell wall elongation regulator TseB-like domain-containing protein n=1 Tax=Lentibacillus sp. CBA3610 TaxID=2518176 RepID=UPI001595C345|nr:DUF5590 domain-containing protein [Lentibacillus sp. CBA3610]QKY69187.1 hypothetical protein Len3610_05785 [Lentibacillus sp. CBA3610]